MLACLAVARLTAPRPAPTGSARPRRRIGRIAGFGAVRKTRCACACSAHPPEEGFLVFGARAALVWTGGGRVWHGRVRSRSAVQESPRASCGTLCEECGSRREQGRDHGLATSHKITRRRVCSSVFFRLRVALDCNLIALTDCTSFSAQVCLSPCM